MELVKNENKFLKFFSTILLGSFFLFATNAYASEPLPWQLGLQPPSGSIAVMANDLHNLLLIVITAIFFRSFESLRLLI